jgi:hypothetical protein
MIQAHLKIVFVLHSLLHVAPLKEPIQGTKKTKWFRNNFTAVTKNEDKKVIKKAKMQNQK